MSARVTNHLYKDDNAFIYSFVDEKDNTVYLTVGDVVNYLTIDQAQKLLMVLNNAIVIHNSKEVMA
jgi:hypothetical protein